MAVVSPRTQLAAVGRAERQEHALPGEETRQRILETAERLFGDYGIDGVSLRTIVAEANVNLAAVNYHFGSKANLFEQVFARRARAITEKRLLRLEQCREAPDRPPLLEQILDAFLAPALEADPEGGGAGYARMRLRLAADKNERTLELPSKYFDHSSHKFLDALARVCAHLPAEDLYWRFHIMIGAMYFTMANPARIEHLSSGVVDTSDTKNAMQYLIQFFATAFRAPATAPGGSKRSGR